MAACIAQWTVGKQAAEICKQELLTGCSAVDAVEHALAKIEDDKKLGIYLVGRGGYPSNNGLMELDAALMDGRDLRFGAVASLQGVSQPCHVARRVMEASPHSLLVGQGAQEFAVNQGFKLESNESLMACDTAEKLKMHLKDRDKMNKSDQSHDTLGLIALDNTGNIVAGVSTSGIMFKHGGRVGDSPLPGGGLYADSQAGAACATGEGDQIMKFCPSFHVVQLMREGNSPQEACESVISSICQRTNNPCPFEMGIIAMNMMGDVGAGSTVSSFTDPIYPDQTYAGFPFAHWKQPHPDVKLDVYSPKAHIHVSQT